MGPCRRGRPGRRARRRGRPSSPPTTRPLPTRGIAMTKRLFDHAQNATLDEQLALEAELQTAATKTADFTRGRRRVPREAPAELHRSLIETVDYHTGGEPFRIVTGGVQPLAGATILDKRRCAPSSSTTFAGCSSTSRAATPTCTAASSPSRTTTAPTSASSSSTTPGYSTACGHGTIALVTWAIDERCSSRGGDARSSSTCRRAGSRRRRASRTAACARCASATCRRSSRRAGSRPPAATVDVAFGGAFYASLEERVEPAELPRLIELGREIKRDLEAAHEIVHPLEPELRDVYGVIFWQDEGEAAAHAAERHRLRRRRGRPLAVRQRHLRAARAARTPSGRLAAGEPLRHLSIVGSEFTRPRRRRGEVAGAGGRHRGRGQRPPDGPARVRARPGRRARRRLPPALVRKSADNRTTRLAPARFLQPPRRAMVSTNQRPRRQK